MAVLSDFQPKLDKITSDLATLTAEHANLTSTNKQLVEQVGTLTAEVNNLNASLTSKLSESDEQTIMNSLDATVASIEALVTPPAQVV